MGIYKRKQGSKKERKEAFDQEKRKNDKDQEKKKEGNGKCKLELNI